MSLFKSAFKVFHRAPKQFFRPYLYGYRCMSCPACSGSGSGQDSGAGSGKKQDLPAGGKGKSGSTIYDARKYGHNLPSNNVCPCFEILPDFPSGVFRNTQGETLGRGAGKCTYYQNPEYFSYHHMSFYDMLMHMGQYRCGCPKTGRKPI